MVLILIVADNGKWSILHFHSDVSSELTNAMWSRAWSRELVVPRHSWLQQCNVNLNTTEDILHIFLCEFNTNVSLKRNCHFSLTCIHKFLSIFKVNQIVFIGSLHQIRFLFGIWLMATNALTNWILLISISVQEYHRVVWSRYMMMYMAWQLIWCLNGQLFLGKPQVCIKCLI